MLLIWQKTKRPINSTANPLSQKRRRNPNRRRKQPRAATGKLINTLVELELVFESTRQGRLLSVLRGGDCR